MSCYAGQLQVRGVRNIHKETITYQFYIIFMIRLAFLTQINIRGLLDMQY